MIAESACIDELYNERFCRMWEFYLACCDASFRHAGKAVCRIQISEKIDAVQITRDYIATSENRHGDHHGRMSR